MAVERQLAFQAQRVARAQAAGNDAELFAGFHHFVPDARAGGFVGGDVNLEAVFGGVAGARDQDVLQSADGAVGEPVELHLRQIGVGEFLQRIDALRPLDRDLREVVAEVARPCS